MPVILGILQRRTPLFERTPCVHDVSEHEGDEQRHHRHHLQGKETRRGIEDGQRTLQVGRRGIEGRPVVTRAQQQTGDGHDRPDARSPYPVTDICAGERNDDAVQHARYARVALEAGKHSGKSVAIFSLEMSREQLVTRLIASEGLVENTRLVTGNLRESDWQRIAEAASSLSRMDIRIDDNPLLTVADMNAKCRRLENLGLVVIDYLQLMTSAGGKGYSGENRQQAVSDISRMLKIMAKELQVPVLCLSQLSRANEKRDDKRPMLSDLRESGAIEQDADIVLFLYRDDYYNSDSEKRNVAECIVAKNRHGETGKVELRWMPEYTAFGTLENRYDDEE